MDQVLMFLAAPGRRCGVECAAPTQVVSNSNQEKYLDVYVEDIQNTGSYTATAKRGRFNRWLDKVVEVSGSEYIYFAIVATLLVWAFMGICFGHSNTWQISISDFQAIVNMVFDAFLMRQQLNSHDTLMVFAASLRSRTSSHKRMLAQLIREGTYEKVATAKFQQLQQTRFTSEFSPET
jgi:low-affinity ferrous iron transport protein